MNLKKNKKWLIAAAVIIILLGGLYRHIKTKNVPAASVIKNVTVQKISRGAIATDVDYPGKLAPLAEITIVPKIAGKVSSINADIGDTVKKGQVLFTLDTTELVAQLKQQQALLDSANANFKRTQGTAVDQQLSSAKQMLDKAQIAYDNAKDDLSKMQQLYDAGAISKQQLDNSSTAANTALIDLKTAQDSFDATKDKIVPQSMEAASAQVAQAQAAVDYVNAQVDDATVTSPIDGVVSARSIDLGEMASSAAVCYTVIDTSSLIAEINVADKVLGKIQAGQSVKVSVSAIPGKSFNGIIDTISPNSDSKNNTYKIRVKLDNGNNDIKPGMFAKISIPAESKSNILTVPNEAIKIENGVKYIYIVDKNKVKKIAVTVGISDDKITEVSGSIKEGDDVITEGQDLLNDGEQVNIAK